MCCSKKPSLLSNNNFRYSWPLMAFSFSKIPLLTYLTSVTLFATHYALTFCLFMGTLYDTTLGPTLFLQTYTVTQPDLRPKSLNELLRHWRSGWFPLPQDWGFTTNPKTAITIISETAQATDCKFGPYIHRIHPNTSPWKIWEKREHGRIQGLPNFLSTPYYLRNG